MTTLPNPETTADFQNHLSNEHEFEWNDPALTGDRDDLAAMHRDVHEDEAWDGYVTHRHRQEETHGLQA